MLRIFQLDTVYAIDQAIVHSSAEVDSIYIDLNRLLNNAEHSLLFEHRSFRRVTVPLPSNLRLNRKSSSQVFDNHPHALFTETE